MRRILALTLMPFTLAAAPPLDAETTKDVRCLLAVSSLVGSDNQAAQMSALIGSQYFLGRIDGRSPNLDLEAALTAEAPKLNQTEMKFLFQSCGEMLKQRGLALKAIGEHMQVKAQSSSSS